MCGRFTLTKDEDIIEYRFSRKTSERIIPHYNIAPSMKVLTITQEKPAIISKNSWGWSSQFKNQSQFVINARAETVFDKVMFYKSIHHHRCLIIADGYYEWKNKAYGKQPYYIRLQSEELFCFAGIFHPKTQSVVILTSDSQGLMRDLHARIPVILHEEAEYDWLRNDLKESDIQTLINNSNMNMKFHPVSMAVNQNSVNNSLLIKEIPEQAELFD